MEYKKVLNMNSVIFLGLVFWLAVLGQAQGSSEATVVKAPEGEKLADQAQLFEGYLYFADAEGSHLKAQPKQFPSGLDAPPIGTIHT